MCSTVFHDVFHSNPLVFLGKKPFGTQRTLRTLLFIGYRFMFVCPYPARAFFVFSYRNRGSEVRHVFHCQKPSEINAKPWNTSWFT